MSGDVFTKHNITSKPILLLAPMQGITSPLFRNAITSIGGMDLVATEFVRISSGNQSVAPFVRHSLPLQIQFMAAKPDLLAQALTQLIQKNVIQSGDWLDLNAGCPSKKVNRHGAGAALLKDPNLLQEMISALRSVWSGPLSLKMRLGFNSVSEFADLLDTLKDAPLDFITIHAKTKKDALDKTAQINTECLKMAAAVLPYPVIGNGDIWTPELALNLINECGLRGVMFGRPAVANPFIFREVRELCASHPSQDTASKRVQMCDFLHSLLISIQEYEKSTKRLQIGTWKELAYYFSLNPLIGSDFFEKTKHLSTLDECKKLLDGFTSS